MSGKRAEPKDVLKIRALCAEAVHQPVQLGQIALCGQQLQPRPVIAAPDHVRKLSGSHRRQKLRLRRILHCFHSQLRMRSLEILQPRGNQAEIVAPACHAQALRLRSIRRLSLRRGNVCCIRRLRRRTVLFRLCRRSRLRRLLCFLFFAPRRCQQQERRQKNTNPSVFHAASPSFKF